MPHVYFPPSIFLIITGSRHISPFNPPPTLPQIINGTVQSSRPVSLSHHVILVSNSPHCKFVTSAAVKSTLSTMGVIVIISKRCNCSEGIRGVVCICCHSYGLCNKEGLLRVWFGWGEEGWKRCFVCLLSAGPSLRCHKQVGLFMCGFILCVPLYEIIHVICCNMYLVSHYFARLSESLSWQSLLVRPSQCA